MKLLQLFQVMESNDEFQRTADAQRGAPERIMGELQMAYGGGVYSYVVEHVGDLTHRMTEKFGYLKGQQNTVYDKVEKTLRTLTHRYGFEREMKENMQNNYQFLKDKGRFDGTFDEFVANIKSLSEQYAKEHEKVPVWNEPQKWARNAAVALGYWQFHTAINYLTKLEGIAKLPSEEYQRLVSQVTLSEAPIKDITTHDLGDRPADTTFTPKDWKAITSPQYQNTVKQKFKGVPYIFNLVFINKDDLVVSRATKDTSHPPTKSFDDSYDLTYDFVNGFISSKELQNIFGIKVPQKPREITVVYGSNYSAIGQIGLTPWIIAHRFVHALEDARNQKHSPQYANINKQIGAYHDSIYQTMRDWGLKVYGYELTTTKSARSGQLERQEWEAFTEDATQFLLTGSVKLARIINRRGSFMLLSNGSSMKINDTKYKNMSIEEINEQIEVFEKRLNILFKRWFATAVGKILIVM